MGAVVFYVFLSQFWCPMVPLATAMLGNWNPARAPALTTDVRLAGLGYLGMMQYAVCTMTSEDWMRHPCSDKMYVAVELRHVYF